MAHFIFRFIFVFLVLLVGTSSLSSSSYGAAARRLLIREPSASLVSKGANEILRFGSKRSKRTFKIMKWEDPSSPSLLDQDPSQSVSWRQIRGGRLLSQVFDPCHPKLNWPYFGLQVPEGFPVRLKEELGNGGGDLNSEIKQILIKDYDLKCEGVIQDMTGLVKQSIVEEHENRKKGTISIYHGTYMVGPSVLRSILDEVIAGEEGSNRPVILRDLKTIRHLVEPDKMPAVQYAEKALDEMDYAVEFSSVGCRSLVCNGVKKLDHQESPNPQKSHRDVLVSCNSVVLGNNKNPLNEGSFHFLFSPFGSANFSGWHRRKDQLKLFRRIFEDYELEAYFEKFQEELMLGQDSLSHGGLVHILLPKTHCDAAYVSLPWGIPEGTSLEDLGVTTFEQVRLLCRPDVIFSDDLEANLYLYEDPETVQKMIDAYYRIALKLRAYWYDSH